MSKAKATEKKQKKKKKCKHGTTLTATAKCFDCSGEELLHTLGYSTVGAYIEAESEDL